jgi:cysteinyl-tRNA synthetase
MALRIYNTLTREKEEFAPIVPGKVRLYVCGVTPYAPSHVGHARCYISFDVVYRWLKREYLVTYVRNYTDIDDKIIKAANAAGEPVRAFAERYIAEFRADMELLGNWTPNIEPKVTDHIPEIIELTDRLIKNGVGYTIDGDVYFEVSKYPAYGRLSGRKQEDLEAGARVAVDERKRAASDFALWKSAKPGEPSWDSPWGKGRPGWHIECSAMAAKYLGEPFDIHGGGKDLVFPHHENEIAQSCAASGSPRLSNVWMHNGFVNLMPESCPKCQVELGTESVNAGDLCKACGYKYSDEDLKMSKTRGNFYPIREIASRYEAEALRFFLLMSHYRTPIAFSHRLLEDAATRLDKNYETLQKLGAFAGEQTFIPGPSFAGVFGFDPIARFKEAMDDDFNTAKAIADLGEVFKIANDLITGKERERIGRMLSPADTSRLLYEIKDIVRDTGDVLGLWLEDPNKYMERRKMASSSKLEISPGEIQALIDERNAARAAKNFKRGDEIRAELLAKGIVLKDSPKGTEWHAKDAD